MTIKSLQQRTKQIRDSAARAYIRARVRQTERQSIKRETDEEIRESLREHDLGSVAFD